jgi:hypothetical protein
MLLLSLGLIFAFSEIILAGLERSDSGKSGYRWPSGNKGQRYPLVDDRR